MLQFLFTDYQIIQYLPHWSHHNLKIKEHEESSYPLSQHTCA